MGRRARVHQRDGLETKRLKRALRGRLLRYREQLESERRQRARAETAQSNLLAVLAASPQPLVVLDTTGVVETWNAAAERVLGWKDAEIVGKPLPIIPTERQEPANEVFTRLLRGESVMDLEIERLRKDGTTVHLSLSAAPLRDSEGTITHIVELYADITQRRQSQLLLEHQATHDPLTGLPNRLIMLERIDEAIAEASDGGIFSVLVMDLDGFKGINDQFGHQMGDEILRAFADRLTNAVRTTDTVARLGGDEFAVLLERADGNQAGHIGLLIAESLNGPLVVGDHTMAIRTSVGSAAYPADGMTAAALLHHADLRMYATKSNRHGTGRRSAAPADDQLAANVALVRSGPDAG